MQVRQNRGMQGMVFVTSKILQKDSAKVGKASFHHTYEVRTGNIEYWARKMVV